MTTFQINQKVTVSAETGHVVAIEAGKRGRTLVTVEFENGSTKKFDSRWVQDTATMINSGFNPGWDKSGSGVAF